MSSMKTRKTKKKMEPSPTTLMSLPDDLLLNCFARISRLYYLSLSSVSKRFRALLASPELYKARSVLGNTESCLYLCMNFYSLKNPTWFTLCRKPDKETLTESSGYVLAKVPIPDPFTNVSDLVAVGSNIYNIRRSGSKSSSVTILDCTSHTWRREEVAPSFPLELWSLSASVLDRKIYVAGSYKDKDGSFTNKFEVFDTKTLVWDPSPFPCSNPNFHHPTSACIEGKFYVKSSGGEVTAYDSVEGRWDMVEYSHMGDYMNSELTYCVIENVIYSVSYGEIKWYDTVKDKWKNLKGLDKFSSMSHVSLADYGGKMAVLWDVDSLCGLYKNIWCAVIAIEKGFKNYGKIVGNVEWFDHVLTIPNSCYFMKILAATI